jgi:hypothetical protein
LRDREKSNIVQVGEAGVELRRMSMKRCKVWEAMSSPNDIKGNTNRSNGVVISFFYISSGCVEIYLYAFTRLILEMEEPKISWE